MPQPTGRGHNNGQTKISSSAAATAFIAGCADVESQSNRSCNDRIISATEKVTSTTSEAACMSMRSSKAELSTDVSIADNDSDVE